MGPGAAAFRAGGARPRPGGGGGRGGGHRAALSPRQGPLLTQAYLRSFADQLVARLGDVDGPIVDPLADNGVLAVRLATGHPVIAVDEDVEALRSIGRMAPGVGLVRGSAGRLPLGDACAGAAASLFPAGLSRSGPALLDELVRIVRPGGRVALLEWSSAPHEELLLAALDVAASHATGWLRGLLNPAVPAPPHGFRWSELLDVARFDSADRVWEALVSERPLAASIAALDPNLVTAARQRLSESLQPWTAADGTLRIPVRCRVLEGAPGLRLSPGSEWGTPEPAADPTRRGGPSTAGG